MRTLLALSQTYAPVGGVQIWLDQLAQGLPQHGWKLVVGLAQGHRFHNARAFQAAHPELETLVLDGRSGTRAGRLLAIEAAIRRVRPAVVVPITLSDPFEVVAGLKAHGSDLRLLFGSYEVSPDILCDVRRYRAVIDRGLGVSRVTAALLSQVGGLAERVDCVLSGVPPAYRAADWRAGSLQLAYVGRFDPDKRPLDLLDLCTQLEARGVDFTLTAIGGGTLGGELAAAAATVPAGQRHLRIRSPLPRGELYASVFPSLSACLLFSPAEGLPSILLEAMMHGVVPVCSDYTGRAAQGLVVHERTGLVFPVGDMAGAAEQIARLAREPGLHARLATQGRAHVQASYSMERMMTGWSRALDRAVDGPPANGPVIRPKTAERDTFGRLLGRRWGELARRALGRTFVHADASEWPHHGVATTEERATVEQEVAAVVRQLDGSGV